MRYIINFIFIMSLYRQNLYFISCYARDNDYFDNFHIYKKYPKCNKYKKKCFNSSQFH